MLHFLKDNSYTIVKCILNQVAMTMFGLMLAFATIQHETMLLLGSLLSIGLYLYLIYYMFWEIGGKDRIIEDGGRRRQTPMRGLLISLTANIPNLILAVLMISCKPFAETSGAAGNIFFVSNILARGFEAMYLGLIQLYSPNNPIGFLLIVLPALVTAHIGYTFGHKNFRILGLFGVKQNTKNETR